MARSAKRERPSVRTLVPILGDRLDRGHPALVRLDYARDRVLFVETAGEAAHVWSHKARIALFFAAMHSFAAELAEQGYAVEYPSKPYAASGQYTNWMSNYCRGCRYDPVQRTGERACPVTVLYWRFLLEHETEFSRNPRTALMAKNAGRLSHAGRAGIGDEARRVEARRVSL